jgi:hypothetical protein
MPTTQTELLGSARMTPMRISRIAVWIAAFGAVIAFATIGCQYFPESTFELANESRLSRWITLPPGLTRADVSITMSYYIKPWGRTATFTTQGAKVTGKLKCNEPFRLKKPTGESASDYPSYELVTVNGISEIIEHRKMEPVFYISDDPEVQKAIQVGGCG